MSLLGLIFGSALAASSCISAPYGNPVGDSTTIPICHQGYYSSYSTSLKDPEVVVFSIKKENVINCNSRKGKFHQDPLADGLDVNPSEYSRSGYDRGHMADAEDFAYDSSLQYDSFSMTNMTPQSPGLNRGGWKWLETASRYWAYEYGEVVVYDGILKSNPLGKIDNVTIPSRLWKIVYIPKLNRAISVIVPNDKISGSGILNYITSVANIEELSGITIPLPSSYNKSSIEEKSFWTVKREDLTSIKSNYCSIGDHNASKSN